MASYESVRQQFEGSTIGVTSIDCGAEDAVERLSLLTAEPSELARSSTPLAKHWLPTLFISLMVLLLILGAGSKVGFSTIWSFNLAIPFVFTTSQWMHLTDEPSFLLEHGIDLRHPVPRQSPISAQSVAYFQNLVHTRQLVAAYNSTLIVGLTNFGYRDLAYNWLCFVRRLNITNFLLLCMDVGCFDDLSLLGYGEHIVLLDDLFPNSTAIVAACVGNSGTHSFRSNCFNIQTRMKTQLVLTSLLAGFHTVLSDMDITLLHNPFLYMPLVHDWEIQLEPNDLCTGWYFNKASAYSIRMQAEVLRTQEYQHIDDQVLYNIWFKYQLLLNQPDAMRDHVFPLNRDLFPIGQQFGALNAVLWHNNWLGSAQQKRARQLAFNVWLFVQVNTTAATSAFVAGLSSDVTTLDASGAKVARWRSVNESKIAAAPSSPLLVCARCVVCDSIVPSVKPLRSTFPGALLTQNFEQFTWPWPEQLLRGLV